MKLLIATGPAAAPRTLEVEAELAYIPDALPFRFAVYQSGTAWHGPTYEVAEASTGYRVGDGPTRKRAGMAAGTAVRKHGLRALYERVAALPTLNEAYAPSEMVPAPDAAYCELPNRGEVHAQT